MDEGLRGSIAEAIRTEIRRQSGGDWPVEADYGNEIIDGAFNLPEIADRILAIPEIAEALRITRGEVGGIVTVREMTRDEITEKFGPMKGVLSIDCDVIPAFVASPSSPSSGFSTKGFNRA